MNNRLTAAEEADDTWGGWRFTRRRFYELVGNRIAIAAILPMLAILVVPTMLIIQRARESEATHLEQMTLLAGHSVEEVVAARPLRRGRSKPAAAAKDALELERLRQTAAQLERADQVRLLVLDSHSRVIYATPGASLERPEDVQEAAGLRALRELKGTQAIVYRASTTPTLAPGNLAARYVTREGWEVVVWRPREGLLLRNRRDYLLAGLILLGAAMLAALIARRVTASVTQPIQWLVRNIAQQRVERQDALLMPPPDSPQELVMLYFEFARLLTRTRYAYAQQRDALDASRRLGAQLEESLRERESVIAQRTAELERHRDQLTEANTQLARLASEDGLTGLSNRRVFDDFLAMSWRIGERTHGSVTVILADLDHFKSYNDAYGHPAGDKALQRAAAALRAVVRRPLDLLARYGGEEFVAVLGDTELDQACAVAEAMRVAIYELAMPAGRPGERVTLSVGVAAVVPGPGRTAEALLHAADQALYRAKAGGRNRVEVAAEAAPTTTPL